MTDVSGEAPPRQVADLPAEQRVEYLRVLAALVSADGILGGRELGALEAYCDRLGLDHGQRVQFSVFELKVDPAQWATCRDRLLSIIDPEHDSLRFYHLGNHWDRRVEHHGTKPGYDPDGPLII